MKTNSKTNSTPRCSENKTYWQGCRCSFCQKQVAAMNARSLHRRDQRKRGAVFDHDLIDVTDTRLLLEQAIDAGITDRDLELMSGVDRASFSRIRRKQSNKVLRRTAVAIAKALEDADMSERHPMTLVDAKWMWQMSQCLTAQGWTRQHQRDILKTNLGVDGGFITSKQPKQTYYKNEQHMKWLLRAIGNRVGPATASAKKMQKWGVFPPKHYNVHGDLVVTTLTKEQKALYGSV